MIAATTANEFNMSSSESKEHRKHFLIEAGLLLLKLVWLSMFVVIYYAGLAKWEKWTASLLLFCFTPGGPIWSSYKRRQDQYRMFTDQNVSRPTNSSYP